MVKQYLDHSIEILTSELSNFKGGSKGMGLISLFGYQNEYDLRQGFPLLTTKRMGVKTIAHELVWFLRGETNVKYLADNGVHIWDGNAFDHNLKRMVNEGIFTESALTRYSSYWYSAKEDYIQRIKEDTEFARRWGEVGPLYGSQWRHWRYVDESGNTKEVDQLGRLMNYLKNNPTGKRAIVTAWNPGEVEDMALPPCHVLYQVNTNEGKMDLQLYQRSCDMFLGVPFNIAEYIMLTHIIAQELGFQPRRFVHTFGDAHFYCGSGERAEWYGKNLEKLRKMVKETKKPEEYLQILQWVNTSIPPEPKGTEGMDHVTAILEQLSRVPRALPKLTIAKKPLDKLTIDDFTLSGYDPYPIIKRALAV